MAEKNIQDTKKPCSSKRGKPGNEPSAKTLWAYWMQAIEQKSEAINKAFPGYHPQWVQLTQMRAVSREIFINMRISTGLSQEQCAAYLHVAISTVARWERGRTPVPFACFELLRVIRESAQFKMSHPEWDGWFISTTGVLVSPDIGGNGFTPSQLIWSTMTRNEAALLRNDVIQLKSELDAAIAENTRLRQMFMSQGLMDELASMQDKISNLMDSIGTAQVIPFRSVGSEQPEQLKWNVA